MPEPAGEKGGTEGDGENSLALWVAKRPEGVRKQLITVFPRRCPSPQARKVAPKVTERAAKYQHSDIDNNFEGVCYKLNKTIKERTLSPASAGALPEGEP